MSLSIGDKVNYIHNQTRKHFFEHIFAPSIQHFTGDLYTQEEILKNVNEDSDMYAVRLPRSNYFVLKLPRLDKFNLLEDFYISVKGKNTLLSHLPYVLSPEPLNVIFTDTKFISTRLDSIVTLVAPRENYYQYQQDGIFKPYLQNESSVPKHICVLFIEENTVYYSDASFNSNQIKDASLYIKWTLLFPIENSLKDKNSVFEGICRYKLTYEDIMI